MGAQIFGVLPGSHTLCHVKPESRAGIVCYIAQALSLGHCAAPGTMRMSPSEVRFQQGHAAWWHVPRVFLRARLGGTGTGGTQVCADN